MASKENRRAPARGSAAEATRESSRCQDGSDVAGRIQVGSALKARDTARSISATDESFDTQDVGRELERLAGAVEDLAEAVVSMARAGR